MNDKYRPDATNTQSFPSGHFGDVSGRLLNSGAEFSWYFSKYVGVGLSISSTDINYDNADKSSGKRLKVDYQQNGASLFLTFGF